MEPGDPPRGVKGIFGMGVIDFGDIDDSGKKKKICEHTHEIIGFHMICYMNFI